MKAFVFTLQKLLDVKEALETAAEERLGRVLRQVQLCKETLKELSARRLQVVGEIEQYDGVQTSRNKIAAHVRYLDRVQARINAQLQRLVDLELEAEEARQELARIMRERESLGKLKEHERTDWLKEFHRREQKETDEFAVSGFLRQHEVEVMVEG